MTLSHSCIAYHGARPSLHVREDDVFAWRALFEAALCALESSLSSGLAEGEKKEGEEAKGGA